jgi:hypothetical protein
VVSHLVRNATLKETHVSTSGQLLDRGIADAGIRENSNAKAHLYEAILLVDRKMDEEFARTGRTQERLGLTLEPGVQVRFLSGEEKRGWEREYAKSAGT